MYRSFMENISWLQTESLFVRFLVWVILMLLVVFILYLIFSLLLFPLMFFYNVLTDKNKSNALTKDDYLLGELTTRVRGYSIGEVIDVGSGTAISSYPAKLFREEDRKNDVYLPTGTSVIIVDFDEQGVALVIKNNHNK